MLGKFSISFAHAQIELHRMGVFFLQQFFFVHYIKCLSFMYKMLVIISGLTVHKVRTSRLKSTCTALSSQSSSLSQPLSNLHIQQNVSVLHIQYNTALPPCVKCLDFTHTRWTHYTACNNPLTIDHDLRHQGGFCQELLLLVHSCRFT